MVCRKKLFKLRNLVRQLQKQKEYLYKEVRIQNTIIEQLKELNVVAQANPKPNPQVLHCDRGHAFCKIFHARFSLSKASNSGSSSEVVNRKEPLETAVNNALKSLTDSGLADLDLLELLPQKHDDPEGSEDNLHGGEADIFLLAKLKEQQFEREVSTSSIERSHLENAEAFEEVYENVDDERNYDDEDYAKKKGLRMQIYVKEI